MYSLRCRDAGFDCNFEIEGFTEEEIMSKVKQHAKADHNFKENDFTSQMVGNIQKIIRKT